MSLADPDSACVSRVLPSPNHGERVGYVRPDCIILHYTGMADGPSAIAWLCNPVSQVSSHYVVEERGRILQLVAESRRAHHAGRGGWAGATDLNSASVGIEIVNGGHPAGLPPYPLEQIDAVVRLCRDVIARHAIRPERILAHSDIAPGRKVDPGEHFPWDRLHRAGVGHWGPEVAATGDALGAGAEGDAVEALQQALADYGYAIDRSGRFDERTTIVVEAFQRHFRPSRVDGIADAGTRATLAAMLGARPAERPTVSSAGAVEKLA